MEASFFLSPSSSLPLHATGYERPTKGVIHHLSIKTVTHGQGLCILVFFFLVFFGHRIA